jgi:glycosyltransferase involved in cell wall biosynthesis
MTKNILLYVPTLEGGGAEKVFINLANYFISKKIKVIIISSYGDSYDELISKGVIVKRLFNKKPSSIKIINLILRAVFMPLFLYATLIKVKPEIFITAVLESNILGNIVHFLSRSKSKFIVRQAGMLSNETHPRKLSFLLRWTFKRVDVIVANSPETKKSIVKFHKISKNKIKVIGNPIYNDPKTEYSSTGELYLMNVGRLETQKDHSNLLKAFALITGHTDVNLKIFGIGSLEQVLKKEASDLKIKNRVEFLGFKSDLDRYYSQARLFVLSSHNEAFGNVIIEAMSFGIPIVSTKCAGPNYILNKPELGELCEIQSPQALANALLKVIKSPNSYPRNVIIERAKDFSIEKIGEEYLRVINM